MPGGFFAISEDSCILQSGWSNKFLKDFLLMGSTYTHISKTICSLYLSLGRFVNWDLLMATSRCFVYICHVF